MSMGGSTYGKRTGFGIVSVKDNVLRVCHQQLSPAPKLLARLDKPLLDRPWIQARESVSVKVLEQEEEFYVYVESQDRVAKERSMRRRKLKRLWARLGELRAAKRLSRDALLMRLGAAKKEAVIYANRVIWRLKKLMQYPDPAAGVC